MVRNDLMILQLIHLYSARRNISVSYASRILTGSGDTARRIGGGMSMTARRANDVLQRASDLWPEGAKWPADIPRPTPNPTDNSCIAELRANGFRIGCRQVVDRATGQRTWRYRMVLPGKLAA